MEYNNLYHHQKQAISFLMEHGSGILAMEMGTGKSACAIIAAKEWSKDKPEAITIVVCPAFLVLNWVREWKKWTDQSPYYFLSSKKKIKGDTRVVIMSYELFKKLVAKDEMHPELVETIIVDESAYIKNYKSARTKALKKFSIVPHKVLLSGTPIINRAYEILPQLQMVKPERYAIPWPFLNKYCEKKPNYWNGGLIINKDSVRNPEALSMELASSVFRVTSDEIEDMPRIVRNNIEIKVGELKSYIHDLIKAVRGGNMNEALGVLGRYKMALARSKAKWIIKNFIGSEYHEGKKILIFTQYRETAHMMAEAAGTKAITGEMEKSKRFKAVNDFQNDDKTYLIATLPSMREGINLGWVDEVYFADLDYTPAAHQQGEARLRRITRNGTVISNYFIAPTTFDDFLVRKLAKKQQLIDAVIDSGHLRHESQNIQKEFIDFIVKNNG